MSQPRPLWLEQALSILECLNQGVIVCDESQRIVFANKIFLSMIGLPAEQILGRTSVELFPAEDVPSLLGHIERGRAEGHDRFEFYVPQHTGERLPIVVTSRQVAGPEGGNFAIITATDISELKRVEWDLRTANTLLESRHREVEEELLLAARVQQSLSPRSLTWGGTRVEAFYEPVRAIGGDFGLVAPSDDYLNLLVCDVSGHGISSALVANRIYAETISQIEARVPLESMLRHLNHFLLQTVGDSLFYVTLAAARLSRGGRRLALAGAGHPPAMVVRPGNLPELIESRSAILGMLENAVENGTTIDIPIEAGDRVFLYTDGLTECFDSERHMLGVDGLRRIVGDVATLPLSSMKAEIVSRVNEWRNGPAADDMSFILLEGQ